MLDSVDECKSTFIIKAHISNVSICLWLDKLLRPLLALLLTLFFFVILEIINNLVLINFLVLVRRAISAAATATASTSLLQLFLRLLLNISKHVLVVVVEPLVLYGMLELLLAGSEGGKAFKGLT